MSAYQTTAYNWFGMHYRYIDCQAALSLTLKLGFVIQEIIIKSNYQWNMFVMLRASTLKTAFRAWLQYHSMKQTELVSIGIIHLLWHEVCLSSIKCAYTSFPTVACWLKGQEEAVSPVCYIQFVTPFTLVLTYVSFSDVCSTCWSMCVCECYFWGDCSISDCTLCNWNAPLWTSCRYFSAWKEYHNQAYQQKALKLKGIHYQRCRTYSRICICACSVIQCTQLSTESAWCSPCVVVNNMNS